VSSSSQRVECVDKVYNSKNSTLAGTIFGCFPRLKSLWGWHIDVGRIIKITFIFDIISMKIMMTARPNPKSKINRGV
jgi:hypothetical protein